MECIFDLLNSAREAGELSAQVNKHVYSRDMAKLLGRFWRACERPDSVTRINESTRVHYRGAVPFENPIHQKYTPEESPLECIGIDGSQIYPEPFNPVLLGWVTALAYQMGEGVVCSMSKSLTRELWNLEDEFQKDYVDLSRSLLEISVAHQIISGIYRREKLVLLDGCLLPWITSARHSRQCIQKINSEYGKKLNLCSSGHLAAVTQNPRSRAIINLLRLLETNNINDYTPAHSGIRDRDLVLFLLEPGERTSVFLNGSQNIKEIEDDSHLTYFFYTRVKNEILRIEIPEWVALDQKSINQVHASILKDSQLLAMPYTLAQAHRHVVVKLDTVEAVTNEANQAYFNAGGYPIYQSIKPLIKKNK